MQRPGSSRQNTAHGANPRANSSGLFPGPSFDAKPLWANLYENLRETLIPSHLPPLELTSKPILVPDRMAARTNPWAIGTATIVNGGIVALVILFAMRAAAPHFPPSPTGAHIDISDLHIFAPAPQKPSDGGNGAGTHDLIDPIEGRNPKFSTAPMTPPMVPLIQQPKLPEESSVNIQLPDNSQLPNIGVYKSANVTLISNGPGSRNGIGWGANGVFGPGNGNGRGPGNGDTVYVAGQGVIPPTLVYAPDPEFSDEARRQKYQGLCMISFIVDANGHPQNLRVIRSLGMGLDEKALAAVRTYRFKPGTKDGRPVPVMMEVEVDFHLY